MARSLPPCDAQSQLQQLRAVQSSRALERRQRTFSLRSFYQSEPDSDDSSLMTPLGRSYSMNGDFRTDSRGRLTIDTFAIADASFGRVFRRRVKSLANDEIGVHDKSDEVIETSRDVSSKPRRTEKSLSKLVNRTLDVQNPKQATSLEVREQTLKAARVKLFAARTAIDVQPELISKTYQQLIANEKKKKKNGDSPGVYSLHISQSLEQQNGGQNGASAAVCRGAVSDTEMKRLMLKCRWDSALNQQLLYDQRYDAKWKPRYTDLFLTDLDKKEKKPSNSQGWVLPLKRICEKTGINSRFFTNNRSMTLPEARAQVLYARLVDTDVTNTFIAELHPDAISNLSVVEYMKHKFDPISMETRLKVFVDHIRADKDHVPLTGKFYNNIKLGKRMFGPSKIQMFESSMIGGMERRLEILDNQVNHIPFTHEASDANQDKCRNSNVHCRDDSRVVLSYPAGEENDFIHANRVKGGPLFNDFIITQAPMDNTIGDFWRMIWQESVALICMLISRKQPERCAEYWPRRPTSPAIKMHGLTIENLGINTASDPLFRITLIRITGPGGEVRHVEHWQADMNNSSNVRTPLNLLRMCRLHTRPVVIHDCLGISRAACLVAIELTICNILKGPTYKHAVQQSVQWLRSHRPFSIETPMQYVFIHRCVEEMFREMGGEVKGLDDHYRIWIQERANRLFLDDIDNPIPGFRLLSPQVDPDILRQARRPPRPNYRREAPDCVGEWPILLEYESKARRAL